MTAQSAMTLANLQQTITENVSAALSEDIGSGDITAQLVSEDKTYSVQVISREPAVLCGRAWVDETFKQVDSNISIQWLAEEGSAVEANQPIFKTEGSARSILTAERTALNFLQLLSGVATESRRYSECVEAFNTTILDTRKTIPGLRLAQKYAVKCGGCENHRIGLYDAYLIKENHIAACGSIPDAISTARAQHPDKTLEIEVETLEEFDLALAADPDIIMLDELSLADMASAVQRNIRKSDKGGKACKLEASGNMSFERIAKVAATGVDYISIGALTKHVRAIDLSMRFI